MAPGRLLAVVLGLLTATCALGSTTIDSTAVDQETAAQTVTTASRLSDDGLSFNPPLLLSESRNTRVTINPATTTTKGGSRQGKSLSLWSIGGSRGVTKSVTETPEELPTPAALTFPVPSFFANLFGGSQQRARAPPSVVPVRRQFRQNSRPSPPRQVDRERRPYREPTTLSRRRDSEDYYYGSDPASNRDSSIGDQSQYTDINRNYDFISDSSYAPRAVQPSKNPILDSDVFNHGYNSDTRENNYRSPPESFGKIEGKDFGSTVNYRNNEVTNFKPSQGDYRNEEYDPLESYYDDLSNENYYDFRDYKSESAQREKELSNHRYQSEESPLFGGIFSSLNPMNYFRAPVTEPPPPRRFDPRTRPGRRAGSPSRFGLHQRDESIENPSVTDYFDFSALESYESRGSIRRKQPEFTQKFGNSDHRRQRINKPRGQRLFREEIPLTGERFQDNFPNNKRNRNAGSGRPLHRPSGRRPSIDDIPPIVNDLASFTKDVDRPLPPPRYDPKRTRGGSSVNRGHSERNQNPIINRSDEFTLNIPSNEIKFEDVPALQHDPRLEPFKYKEDFPLRDDLYVGKDGNIYLKGENSPETEPATLTDSDAFLGLHMYGMDHPLFQEISKSRTRNIGSEPFDSMDLETSKQSRDISTLKPVMNRAQFTETKEIFRNESPRLKTTAHRRPPTHRPTIQTSSPTERRNPFLTTPGNVTPYMSNFAKTLIKVKKAAEVDTRPVREYDLRHLRNLKD